MKLWICGRLYSICLKKKIMKLPLKSSKYKKMQCLLHEININLCERNHKVVYVHEGIYTCEGHVGKL
jgi:hypothetical protein